MKRCPSCQQTYPDDAPEYCPNEGMRLVSVESAATDSESEAKPSGTHDSRSQSQDSTPAQQDSTAQTGTQPQQTQSQPQSTQEPQQWPLQAAGQNVQQGWSSSSQQSTQQPAAALGSSFQHPQAYTPYNAPPVFQQYGRSRSLAIAALVFGTNAVNIMVVSLLTRMPSDSYSRIKIAMGVLSIAGVVFGVAALTMALRRPYRFGGVELSIIGLATSTAALVYLLLS